MFCTANRIELQRYVEDALTARLANRQIPESLHQDIQAFCMANDLDVQHFIHEALAAHLASLQN